MKAKRWLHVVLVAAWCASSYVLAELDMRPAHAVAIDRGSMAVRGENYLVDLESALVDITLHYKFSDACPTCACHA